MKGQNEFQQGETYYFLSQYSKAITYFKQAADSGYPSAYLRLGYIYESGLGISPDAKQAEQWYLKARQQSKWFEDLAIKGSPENLYYLGLYYEIGSKETDKGKAIPYYQKA